MGVIPTTDGTTAQRLDLRLHLTLLVAPDNLPSHRRLRRRRHLNLNRKVRHTMVVAGRVKDCGPRRLTRLRSSVSRTVLSGERGVQTLSTLSSLPQVGKMFWLKHLY